MKIIIAILISWEGFTPSTHSGTKLKESPPTTTAIQPMLYKLIENGWNKKTNERILKPTIALSTTLACFF